MSATVRDRARPCAHVKGEAGRADLHLSELVVAPAVHLHGANKAQVHAEAAVLARAVQAEERPVRHRRPLRVRVATVEAFLQRRTAARPPTRPQRAV